MVSKTVLTNGVTVVSSPVPGFRSCSIGLWIKTGSRYETESQAGLSHFIEHMLFKGTARRTAERISQEMDSVGAQIDAFTEKEHTCFYARVVEQHFDLAWDVLSDMLLHSLLDGEELDREKGVILEEIAMYEDNPEDVAFETFHGSLWPSHPLGLPILGNRARIASYTPDDLRDYMVTHYTADRLVVAVAGNVEHEEIVQRVSSWNLPACESSVDLYRGGVPATQLGTVLKYRDDEQENICLGVPGLSAVDERRYAMVLLDSALGGSMSCRLFQEIREKRGLAYSVGTFQNGYLDCGTFGIYAGVSPDKAAEVLGLCCQVVDDVCQRGLTAEELQRTKEYVKGTMALGLESTSALMMRLAKTESLFGRYVGAEEVGERLDAVTNDDIVQVAREVLGAGPLHLVAVGPLRKLQGVGAI